MRSGFSFELTGQANCLAVGKVQVWGSISGRVSGRSVTLVTLGVGPQQPFNIITKGLITGRFQPSEGPFWGQNGAFKDGGRHVQALFREGTWQLNFTAFY